MSDNSELRKLQAIIDDQADRILDLEAALKEAGEMWVRKDNRIEALEAALLWVVDIADKHYEQDRKLRSEGARTLKRISDRSRAVLAQSSPPERLDSVEAIAKALLMEGRITPNTARALMALAQSPPDGK